MSKESVQKPSSQSAKLPLLEKLTIDTTRDNSSKNPSDTLRTVKTAATTDSESSPSVSFTNAPSFSSIETPTVYKSRLFSTPSDQPTAFVDLGISPNALKLSLEEAEARIIDDEILDEEFVPSEDVMVRRCIVFLYAMEFFWNLTREERMEQIKYCVDRPSENLLRLRRIAFSDASDRISLTGDAFEHFFNMASTARMFFDKDGVVGGFPMDPFECLQACSCCYMISACTWYTLMLQRNIPNAEHAEEPIDVAQCARRMVIVDDNALVERVIHDKGGCAYTLATKLTDRNQAKQWEWVRFDTLSAEARGIQAMDSLNYFGFGLVTGFIVAPPFRQAAVENRTGMGYWKFDGISIDCEGEFVVLRSDDKCPGEGSRLLEKWTKQRNRVEEKAKKRKEYRALATPSQLFPVDDVDVAETADNERTASSVTSAPTPGAGTDDEPTKHSMVMLGGYRETINGKTENYFMLLNWWVGMPLVLVSSGYLRACQCKVIFLVDKLTEDTKLARKEGQYAESCYPDAGEDGAAILASFNSLDWSNFLE